MRIDPGEKITASNLSEICGYRSSQINSLVANGVLHPEGKPRKYAIGEAVRDLLAYAKGLSDPGKAEERDLEKKKLKAETALKASRAAEAQMELAELSGKMHSAEDVKAAFEQLVYGIRSILMALPGRLAIDVSGAADAAEAADIIRGEINHALEILAQYEYDPDFFSERVRDRKGWYGAVEKYAQEESGGSKPHNRKRN